MPLTPEQKEAAAAEIIKLDAEGVKDQLKRNARIGIAASQAAPAAQAPQQYQAQPVFGGMPGVLGLQPSQINPENLMETAGTADTALTSMGIPAGALPQPPPQMAPGVQEAGQTAGLAAAQSMTGVPTLAPEVPVQKEAAFTQPPQPAQAPGMAPVRGPGLGGIKGAFAGKQEALSKQAEGIGLSAEERTSALEREADVLIKGEKEKSRVLTENQQLWEKTIGEQQQRELERQEAVDLELNKVRGAIETMKASKIDPYRFYKHPDGNTDYPKSIAAVIAVGLGSLGSSLPASMGGTGGPNRAMDILNRSIDRDIDAQKSDIANQRAGVGLQMNLLSQMRQTMDTERGADSSTRIIMLKTAEMKVDETLARNPTEKMQAKAGVLKAAINAEAQKLMDQIVVDKSSVKLQEEQVLFQGRQQQAALRAKQQAAAAKAAGSGPPTLKGFVAFRDNEKNERTEARKIQDSLGGSIDAMSGVIKLHDEMGG